MKTTRELVQNAKRLFDVDGVPHRIRRHNRHQWVRSVQNLGPRWVYWETIDLRRKSVDGKK
jgi:hypothetical protein